MSESTQQHEPAVKYFLKSVQIEPTNICNIQCVYCRNKRIKHRTTLSAELWGKIFANWNAELFPSDIAICGFGEPFCNKDIYDLFDAVDQRGAKMFVQSNGKWKLNESRADSFFKIDVLRVTVDSLVEEMACVTRPTAHVQDIMANLARILLLRKQRGSQTPRIVVQMNVFRHNRHHCHELIRACRDLGVDGVLLSSGTTVFGLHGTLPASVREMYKDDGFVRIDEQLLTTKPLDRYLHLLMLPEELRVQEGILFAKSVVALQRIWHDPRIVRIRTAGASAMIALGDRVASSSGDSPRSDPPGSEGGGDPGPGFFEMLGCPLLTIRSSGDVTPCCYDTSSSVSLGSLLVMPMKEILAPSNVARVAHQIVGDQDERRRNGRTIECDRCPRFRKSSLCRRSTADLLLRG